MLPGEGRLHTGPTTKRLQYNTFLRADKAEVFQDEK